MASYWKAACSPEIVIEAGTLSLRQRKWWEWLILNGLGQFFYENKIDFTKPGLFKITSPKNSEGDAIKNAGTFPNQDDKTMLPIGGGKDSAVTLEIFKRSGKKMVCFALNPSKDSRAVMAAAGCDNFIAVKRTIDKKLLKLNRQGYLNGHTPFSAYLAFLTTLTAALFDCRYIAVSNERSSNEATLDYLGKKINHQWSKTFSFEERFQTYSKKYLNKGILYFSFLRPFYELQIAKIFSGFKKYFNSFLSCNEAYKIYSGQKTPAGQWCCNCSKCLFAFIILYPFLGKEKMTGIFGQDLFANADLLETVKELTGEKPSKPLECVGERKESLAAFYLSLIKAKEGSEKKMPVLLEYFERKIMPKHKNLARQAKKILSSWNKKNSLPEEFEKILLRKKA